MLFNTNQEVQGIEKPLDTITYIGVVEDNADPKGLYRARVRIDRLFGEDIPKEKLPWYFPKFPVGQGSGSFAVPDIGTTVTVVFPTKDIYMGVIDGVLYTEATVSKNPDMIKEDPIIDLKLSVEDILAGKLPTMTKQKPCSGSSDTNYPHSLGFVDKVLKWWWRADKKEKSFEAVHPSGSMGKIDKDGNVTLHITGNLKFIVDGDFIAQFKNINKMVSGSENIKISNGQEITASTVHKGDISNTGNVTNKGTLTNTGNVSVDGKLDTTGDINSGGKVIDAGGNTNHHSHP